MVDDNVVGSGDEESGPSTELYGRNSKDGQYPGESHPPQLGVGASRTGLYYGNGSRSYCRQFQYQRSTGPHDSDGEVPPTATDNMQSENNQNPSNSSTSLNPNLIGPSGGCRGGGNGSNRIKVIPSFHSRTSSLVGRSTFG